MSTRPHIFHVHPPFNESGYGPETVLVSSEGKSPVLLHPGLATEASPTDFGLLVSDSAVSFINALYN